MEISVGKVFGIDLGTTYSCIAAMDKWGRPVVYNNRDNQATTPSVVRFTEDNEVVVGLQAKRSALVHPDEVASVVKRKMGDPDWRFRAWGTDYAAPSISSQVLKSLARDVAEQDQSGATVTEVVITVPAYTGHEFREATKFAGELAGLKVIDIINEPTAAAFAYGFLQEGNTAQTVLVYDLGGGTFDVTVIRLAEKKIQVVATDGDPKLGGVDWDEAIAAFLADRFAEIHPDARRPSDSAVGSQHLMNLAEEVKQSLSQRSSYLAVVQHDGVQAEITMTRDELEELTAGLLHRTIDLTRRVLEKAATKGVTAVDQILLVGGMSKSPAVKQRIQAEFGIDTRLTDPDLAVAKGAAIFGQKRELESYVLESLRSRGALTEDEQLEDADPATLAEVLRVTADERAMGREEVGDLVATQISNVTSRGFGVQVLDRKSGEHRVEFLAHAQDELPISVEQQFYTSADNQTAVLIKVFEQNSGDESQGLDANTAIISGEITGVPHGWPKDTPVDVRLDMGTDQVITVTARHRAVNEPLVLTIKVGAASAAMREVERAKVDELKQRE
ncbi:molecular chaperone DnaK (HSP70) [Actinoplanes octamycinicus]|uniref:Molecular chaperone DnaK (HSP70) n=1 Tax=Actinoplanes octamycinicus TaxID=135948 RepID=A0A7W7H085_9ACTN|nr:Hsp70 family protein [Actinoplanes octamycinicus]MBB4741548.1 molecular chaperone DnaK (HSP70) [Actinoplanes octamycinicus]GIE57100.1 molecular chaperone DnaK [Actinoplanes octamycinicus]